MSGSTPPGSLPPEVPEEFAAAYRAAYERALAAQSEGLEDEEEPDDRQLGHRRAAAAPGPAGRRHPPHRGVRRRTDDGREGHRLPVVRARAARDAGAAAGPRGVRRGPCVRRQGQQRRQAELRAERGDERGRGRTRRSSRSPPRRPARVRGTARSSGSAASRAKATCTSPPGQDASGAKVSYAAANLTDGVADTTWRCDGTGIGKKITLRLPDKTADRRGRTDPRLRQDRRRDRRRPLRREQPGHAGALDDRRHRGRPEAERLDQRPQPAAAAGAEERRRRGAAGDPGRGQGAAQHDRDQRGPARPGRASDPVSQRSRAPS